MKEVKIGAARWPPVSPLRATAPAMAEFVRRYHAPVAAYLRVLTGDDDRAADLAQGFFEQRILTGTVLTRADRSRGGFRQYLKRAIRNFCLDRLRHDLGREQRLVGREAEGDVGGDALFLEALHGLQPGRYALNVGARSARKYLDYVRQALGFEVLGEASGSPWFEETSGLVQVDSDWTVPAARDSAWLSWTNSRGSPCSEYVLA